MIIHSNKAYAPALKNSPTDLNQKTNTEASTIFRLTKKTINNIINEECSENSTTIKAGLDLIA